MVALSNHHLSLHLIVASDFIIGDLTTCDFISCTTTCDTILISLAEDQEGSAHLLL